MFPDAFFTGQYFYFNAYALVSFAPGSVTGHDALITPVILAEAGPRVVLAETLYGSVTILDRDA